MNNAEPQTIPEYVRITLVSFVLVPFPCNLGCILTFCLLVDKGVGPLSYIFLHDPL
jgi:hypothetical protein